MLNFSIKYKTLQRHVISCTQLKNLEIANYGGNKRLRDQQYFHIQLGKNTLYCMYFRGDFTILSKTENMYYQPRNLTSRPTELDVQTCMQYSNCHCLETSWEPCKCIEIVKRVDNEAFTQ